MITSNSNLSNSLQNDIGSTTATAESIKQQLDELDPMIGASVNAAATRMTRLIV